MTRPKVSLGFVISAVSLTVLLGLSALGVVMAFRIGGVRDITVHGWIALGLAVVFTAVLAGGLIWLAFYSSRHGYDEP